MAFENMTYEVILSQMMARVTNSYPSLDTREGSILFNAHAPAALEMAILYTEIDNAIAESFVDTASREYILTHCEQMGMDTSAFEANAGVHLAVFDVEVAIGSRWNCDLYNYEIVESYDKSKLTELKFDLPTNLPETPFYYKMRCETVGTAPNNTKGEMTPINDNPIGLEYKELVGCLIQGENETSDEDIRQAYFNYVNDVQIDGNIAQYEKWCKDFDGIGNCKILPMYDKNELGGNVTVLILDVDNTPAEQELIDKFQEFLDPGSTGMGDGQAPIGAKVTVGTATYQEVKVTAKIKWQDGYTNADVQNISDTVNRYFRDISFKKKNGAYITTIPYMTLGSEIMKTEGLEFITDLEINDGRENVTIETEKIPTLVGEQWEEITDGN